MTDSLTDFLVGAGSGALTGMLVLALLVLFRKWP